MSGGITPEMAFLLEHLEDLAEAPGGVKRVRELIVELAVWGRLTRRPTRTSTLSSRISECLTGPFGSSLHASDYVPEGVPVVNPQNLQGGRIVKRDDTIVSKDKAASLASFKLRLGDVVVARRGEMGRCAVVSDVEVGWLCGTGSLVLRPGAAADPAFLALYIGSPGVRARLLGDSVGSTMANLNQRIMLALDFPALARDEQHRIVAEVDELMARCDGLEAGQKAREAARTAARAHALTALREAEGADAVDAAWQRIVSHADDLFAAAEDVAPLRETVLELAVRGRLVPQDPADEPASKLLARIRAEKERLVREGKIKKEKPLPPISAEDKPFQVPRGWEWARLSSLGDWGAGATPNRGNPAYFGGSHNWFKSGELNDGTVNGPSSETVTDLALRDCSLRENASGDVLIAMYGATIGKVAILAVPGTTNQAVCACTCHTGLENHFLFLLLRSMRRQFIGQGEGGAQPNISKEKIVATPVGLPPLPEQHRIVAKVDALTTICTTVETALRARTLAHTTLADTLVRSISG